MSFFEIFQSFLFSLRDDYGFLIPADRLKDCLVCAENVCDVEEVCYRVQSLVCENQEQVATFQSIFAQTFLNKRPSVPGEGEKDKKGKNGAGKKPQKTPEERLSEVGKQIESHEKKIQQWSEDVKSLERELSEEESPERQQTRQKLAETKGEIDTLSKEVTRAREEAELAGDRAMPDMQDERLQNQLQTINNAMQDLANKGAFDIPDAKEVGGLLKHDIEGLPAALLDAAWKNRINLCENRAMEFAKAIRNSNAEPGLFTSALVLAGAIASLSSAAEKSISRQKKDVLKEAKKAVEARRRELDAKQMELSQLRLKVSSWDNQRNNKRSVLGSKVGAIKESQARIQTLKAEESSIRSKIAQERGKQQGELVIKERATIHRKEFLPGITAVQTTAEVAELMETDLNRMSAAEKTKILSYIRANARVFRQTLRKKSASIQHRRVDVKATVRAAAKTNGEPIVIKYKAPKKSHAKVMILVDISGSCRDASTMALYFMALMDEAFPGGCRKFAFVKDLVPVDQYFRDRTADEGIEAVHNNIPTRGVYSDYGQTIHRLREEYSGTFTSDTTVIFLGDARNNKNDSHAEDLKYIADRTKRVIWLNTDPINKWNQGDSVIGKYAEAGAEVYPVSTAGDLLSFFVWSERGQECCRHTVVCGVEFLTVRNFQN